MDITRDRPRSAPGPAERFTGEVWIDEVTVAAEPARLRAFSVHFCPGARTAWHTHPFGQAIHVMEGTALVQCEGSSPVVVEPGQTVRFEPGEWHWHGAAPGSFMTHLAMQEADEERVDAHWGPHVTDDEYRLPT